jgi:MarR family transcriptional repressor of mepA
MMEDHKELGKLFFSIGRLQKARADQYLDQIGLFRGQGMLLKFLHHHDGLTHSEIAEKLEISPAAVTKVIKRLEEQNLLKRQSDPKDDRISRVFIQPEGKKVADDLHTIFHQLDERMFLGFSDDELDKLHDFLIRMQSNLQLDENYTTNPIGSSRHGFHRHF